MILLAFSSLMGKSQHKMPGRFCPYAKLVRWQSLLKNHVSTPRKCVILERKWAAHDAQSTAH